MLIIILRTFAIIISHIKYGEELQCLHKLIDIPTRRVPARCLSTWLIDLFRRRVYSIRCSRCA